MAPLASWLGVVWCVWCGVAAAAVPPNLATPLVITMANLSLATPMAQPSHTVPLPWVERWSSGAAAFSSASPLQAAVNVATTAAATYAVVGAHQSTPGHPSHPSQCHLHSLSATVEYSVTLPSGGAELHNSVLFNKELVVGTYNGLGQQQGQQGPLLLGAPAGLLLQRHVACAAVSVSAVSASASVSSNGTSHASRVSAARAYRTMTISVGLVLAGVPSPSAASICQALRIVGARARAGKLLASFGSATLAATAVQSHIPACVLQTRGRVGASGLPASASRAASEDDDENDKGSGSGVDAASFSPAAPTPAAVAPWEWLPRLSTGAANFAITPPAVATPAGSSASSIHKLAHISEVRPSLPRTHVHLRRVCVCVCVRPSLPRTHMHLRRVCGGVRLCHARTCIFSVCA